MKVFFPDAALSSSLAYRYAVIAARFQGQWLLCKNTARNAWELPDGKKAPHETIEETARRALAEKAGASGRLSPIGPYGVKREDRAVYGFLYLAEIEAFNDALIPSEKAGRGMFTLLPEPLTHPILHSRLFRQAQDWLNLQSNADELWDVYDENRRVTGRLHRRGDPMQPGDYHLSVHIWIKDHAGRFLLTKRAPTKGFPLMWESTGGSALAGDDSLSAALREVREETGITLLPENGKCLLSMKRKNDFCDVWLFRQEVDLKDVVLLEGETCDARLATIDEIKALFDAGQMVPYAYFNDLISKLQ